MAKRRTIVAGVVVALLVGLLALAWIDGGREEQRMIVQPVELKETGA